MNGRIAHDNTPEGRLGAVARSLVIAIEENYRKTKQGPSEPDYADFRDALRPYIQRELLLARYDESQRQKVKGQDRIQQIVHEIYEIEATIPEENRL